MDLTDDPSELSSIKDDEDLPEELSAESDSELDIAINEELISKSQEEIKKRMSSLTELISGLKEQLKNEKELWKLEIEHVINSQNAFMSHALCHSQNYYNNVEETSDFPRKICGSSHSEEEVPMRFCDHRCRHLNKMCRREMEIENYRRKLMEVESMCTKELNRVKNNVQSLQVLQQVAAEWDQASGDAGHKYVHLKSMQATEGAEQSTLKSSGDSCLNTEPREIIEA